jgi:hypothetical protein
MTRATASSEKGYWRWNVNFPWECFSSGWEFLQKARISKKEHQLFTNVRASVMFFMTYMEASLNERVRIAAKRLGLTEDDLLTRLRKPRIMDKLKEWPALLAGSDVRLDAQLLEQFERLKDVRDGIVHWKEKDHSKYKTTNVSLAEETCDCVTRITLALCQILHEEVPYWLLGVNFMNPAQAYELCLMRNHEFWWHIQRAGVRGEDFEPLCEQERFFRLRQIIGTLGSEPISGRFPLAPRLTPRWWLDGMEEMDTQHKQLMKGTTRP